MTKQHPWWQTVFDEKYVTTYAHVFAPEQTQQQVDFILEKLKFKRGARILDLACGSGRIALPLAKKGLRVTAVDYSIHLLRLAKAEAKKQKLPITFFQRDMRRIFFRNQFDAVLNIYTSFGYFDDEKDHMLVLHNIARSLKKGGLFLLDFNNTVRTLINLFQKGTIDSRRKMITNLHQDTLANGVVLQTQDEFTPATMRWKMIRSWREKGKRREYFTDGRLFTLPELKNMLAAVGLCVEQVWGDFDGSTYGPTSRRMILLARKK